jgi:hypothetical protein
LGRYFERIGLLWGDFSLEFFLPFSYTVDKNAETAEQNMEKK